jgi:hypothetical protein
MISTQDRCLPITAKSISLDNTFRAVGKATVVDKQHKHTKMMKGGLLGMLNERSETIGWVRCHGASSKSLND